MSAGKKRARQLSSVDLVDAPVRDCNRLYATQTTLNCAQKRRCIPCVYKIGCFDVALDSFFCKRVPNQRPEQCPRSEITLAEEGTLGYQRNMRLLTVGDGDFSFSLAVARILERGSLIATSYDSRETLSRVYPGIEETLTELESLGTTVCYEVDATLLPTSLPLSLQNQTFHRIVWNFPCTSIAQGQDGQNEEMEHNKELVRKFVSNARHLLKPDGQIHINHKTKPPFNQWQIEEVAVEDCRKDVICVGRVVFDRYLLPPYIPRKALHRKSFPTHDACTYIFSRKSSIDSDVLNDAEIETGADANSVPSAGNLVPVTADLIHSLRDSFLQSKNQQSEKQMKKPHKRIKRY